MSDVRYIPNATTPAEHANNVRYQLDNVEGYLEMCQKGQGNLEDAATKARSLQDGVSVLVATLEAAARRSQSKYPEHKPNAEVIE